MVEVEEDKGAREDTLTPASPLPSTPPYPPVNACGVVGYTGSLLWMDDPATPDDVRLIPA